MSATDHDYPCECAWCGLVFPRSELAWHHEELECAPCEVARQANLAEHNAQFAGRPYDGIPER